MSKRRAFLKIKTPLLLLLILAIPCVCYSSKGTLTLGVQKNFPPFAFIDESMRTRGFALDLARMLSAMMGMSLKLHAMNNENSGNALRNGDVDLIALVAPPADMKDIQLIDTGIAIEKRFFVNNSCVTVTCANDLPGHRLVVDNDTPIAELVQDPSAIEVIRAGSHSEALQLLHEGKADVYYSPCSRTSIYLIQKMGLNNIREVGLPVRSSNLMLAVRKGNSEILSSVSMNFGKMIENGHLELLRSKWLGKDPIISAWHAYLRYIVWALGICLTALMAFGVWNRMLHNRVQRVTDDLHQSEKKYRDLIESSPEMIHLITPDGSVRLTNRIAHQRLNSNPEFTEAKIYDYIAQEYREGARVFLFTVFKAGFGKMEMIFEGKGETPIHVEMIATTVHGVGGTPMACCFSRDITERKHLEDELIKAERLAIMGRMAAGIAHEINNPLGIIMANSEELLNDASGLQLNERQSLETIARNAERAGDILHNLLSFTKPGPLESAVIYIEDVIDESLLFLQQKMKEKKIAVKKELVGEDLSIFGNYSQIQQVVINLILNAIQAVAAGGGVTVRLIGNSEEGAVRLEVEDNGVGIPDGDIPRIFDPFFTSHKQGFGLGLFISKTIVERHNGVFEVKSRSGLGTTMSVLLPTRAEMFPSQDDLRSLNS